MLPSKGYFMNIICPHKECTRSYCHYRHSKDKRGGPEKKSEGSIYGSAISSSEVGHKENEVSNVYSQLNNNIMNEMTFFQNKLNSNYALNEVSYNPTPISKLSTKHIPIIPPPTRPTYSYVVKVKKASCSSLNQESDNPRHSNVESTNYNEISGNKQNMEESSSVKLRGTCMDYEDVSEAHEPSIELPVKNSVLTPSHVNTMTSKGESNNEQNATLSKETLENGEISSVAIVNNKYEENQKSFVMEDKEVYYSRSLYNMYVENEEQENKKSTAVKIMNTENENPAIVQKQELFLTNILCSNILLNNESNCKKKDSNVSQCMMSQKYKRKHSKSKESFKKSKFQTDFIDLGNSSDEESNMEKHGAFSSSKCQIEDFQENKQCHGDSPPNDGFKNICNSRKTSLSSSLSLCERWKQAKERILKKESSKSNLMIQPASNVQLLLKRKDIYIENSKIKQLKKQEIENTECEGLPELKTKIRTSRISLQNIANYPTHLLEETCKIPTSIRNQGVRNLFDEFCKYISPASASKNAQLLELDICRRVQVINTYKSAIAVAVLKIRKQKGKVYEVDNKKEILLPFSTPSFTNGWTLYKCFSEYILSDEQYKSNGFPIAHKTKEGCAYIEKSAQRYKSKPPIDDILQQTCDHCSKIYSVDETGFPLEKDNCFYHWGKLRRHRACGGIVDRYTCCGGDLESEPCTNGVYHVCNMFDENLLVGFVSTNTITNRNVLPEIYGVDCEMCYTTKGIELTRCTVVDLNGQKVYDEIVVPDNPILDFCTRFSGITEEIVNKANLKLKDIQKDLLGILNEKTILVGHSLENDLKVLKLFHKNVVDTSVVFPHKNGLPFKQSLKKIAKDLINMTIQESENGHDSFEDAYACINIMLWKIKEDAKKRKPRTIISFNSQLQDRGKT